MSAAADTPGPLVERLRARREMFERHLFDLLGSVLEVGEPAAPTEPVRPWLAELGRRIRSRVELVPFAELESWAFDDGGNLRHASGQFFSIEGLEVETNVGVVPRWGQPIINQPEVGILGLLCQKRSGVLRFLFQAKIEPGNLNGFQLAPTVQATRSNYTKVHKGRAPEFLEHFLPPLAGRIHFDQLQSEQGGRFLRKRNRNVLIEIDPSVELEVPESFVWLTLGQIKALATEDNTVGMDARTVLSCTQLAASYRPTEKTIAALGEVGLDPFRRALLESLFSLEEGYRTSDEIFSWFTGLKTEVRLHTRSCDLATIEDWVIGESTIHHREHRFFDVIGARVEIEGREVKRWCQPLVRQREEGIVGLIVRPIHGILHFLVQAKVEPGNFDVLEMAPTVQCITGSYRSPGQEVPFLDVFTRPGTGRIRLDTLQSEEGGRFYREQNRNVVVEVDESFPIDVPSRYCWMTLGQIKELVRFNNYFNVEARSLIACISPI